MAARRGSKKHKIGWADLVVKRHMGKHWPEWRSEKAVARALVDGAVGHLCDQIVRGELRGVENPKALAEKILRNKASDLLKREVGHRGHGPLVPEEGAPPIQMDDEDPPDPESAEEARAREGHAAHVRARLQDFIPSAKDRLGWVLLTDPSSFESRMVSDAYPALGEAEIEGVTACVVERLQSLAARTPVDDVAYKAALAAELALTPNALEAMLKRARPALAGAMLLEDVLLTLLDAPQRFAPEHAHRAGMARKDQARVEAVQELTELAATRAGGEIELDPYREQVARLLFTKWDEAAWGKARNREKREAAMERLDRLHLAARERHAAANRARRGEEK